MTSVPSQSSEELSDSETPSAIGSCIEDDKEFIRNARARTMVNVNGWEMIEGGNRVASLWEALCRLPSSLQKRVFLDLLEGSDDGEDIWLWNEGDEALMGEVHWWSSPPPWTSAAAVLERCLARTPAQTLRRREVRCTAFEMRAATIVWLALTSAVYKCADEERGVRDREEWDMKEWMGVWHYSLPSGVRDWLDQHSKSYDDQAFTGAMDQAGHSCHKPKREWVTWWLFMRSELLPAQQDHIIYLGGDHCAPCLAHNPTHESESPPSWIPEPALVALRDMWDNIESDYDERCDFSKWLLHHPIYGFKEANEFLRSLPQDNDENEYLSWVNTYPSALRYTVTGYTLTEWQAMDDCLTGSERGGSPNISSWCAAICWRMMPDLSNSACVERFIEVWRYYGLEWSDFLPPSTPAPEFCDAIRVSGHTCWEELQMDDYAAAMAFLDEEAKVVSIDVRKDSGCQVCRLQWHLRSLGEILPGQEQGALDDPQGWINGRKIACIDSSKMICKLPLGLIYMYSMTVDTDSVEHSDLTLDICNSTAMRTMSRYLAWKSMIIKSFGGFPEGTLDLDQIHRIIHLDTITICAHLLNVIKNADDYKQFTSESQPLVEAQESLNLLLQLLDLDDLPSKVRSCFTKAMARLCRKTGLYPECLTLNGLQKIGGRVDGGGFGDVSIGILRGTKVSIKTPRVPQWELKRLLKDFSREIIIWSQLSHPNVLPLYGIYYLDHRETSQACIVSPWMEHGNLLKFLTTAPEQVNRSSLILDIASGLEYLHKQTIIHGDLKALNVLVTPSLRACIMDFGLSMIATSQMATSSASSNNAGTLAWQAPETMSHVGRNTQKSDMYSFACVCYEIFTGKPPFCEHENLREMAIMLKVLNNERPTQPASSELNDTVWNCMTDCWKHNPDERPTAGEIVQRLSAMPEISELDRPSSDTEWDESFARRLRSSLRENPLLPTIEQLQTLLPGAYRSSTPIFTVSDAGSSDKLSDLDSAVNDLGSMDSYNKSQGNQRKRNTVDLDSEEMTMPLKRTRLDL
ncbi:hypothetical protein C8J56DRAFT_1026825 [Mycena floridula]|nr:hypothetical protein C8J56DRAFT_1026825 [Mycena floridula]